MYKYISIVPCERFGNAVDNIQMLGSEACDMGGKQDKDLRERRCSNFASSELSHII
jgi:hypothetical protein